MSATSTPPSSGKPLQSSSNQSQRTLLKGLSIVSLAFGLWLILENASRSIHFNLFGDTYQTSLAFLLAITGTLFLISTGLFFYSLMIVSNKQTQVSQRKVERLEVSAETSSERVKVLEHKIETLEIALKKAIDDKRKS